RLHRLPDRRRGKGRRHVNDRGIHARFLFCVLHRAKNRNALEILAGLLRIHAGHVAFLAVRVGAAGLRVEHPGLAGDALRHHAGVVVDEDAHFFFFLFTAAFFFVFTTVWGFVFFFFALAAPPLFPAPP